MQRTLLALLTLSFSFPALTCTFLIKQSGTSSSSAKDKEIESALRNISSEFEYDPKTGTVHFKSKREVGLQEVQKALANISDVEAISVHGHKK